MNCTHIERLIPLYIGGDLNPQQLAALRQHLESCDHCNGLVAEFEESQSWLRDHKPPEFDDVVFDNLRTAVRDEIARECGIRNTGGGTVWSLRYAIAAAAVLVVLAVGYLLYNNRQISPDKSLTVSRRENLETSGKEIAIASKVQQIPRKKLKATHRSHNSSTLPKKLPVLGVIALNNDFLQHFPSRSEVTSKREPEMLRIEIQTADPNIRIIWFVPNDDAARDLTGKMSLADELKQ
jgi:putative zinc finger protein